VIGAAAYRFGQGQGALHLAAQLVQDRGEAEAFAAKFGPEKTYLVVPGSTGQGHLVPRARGRFSRTAKDAYAGKLAFEKKARCDMRTWRSDSDSRSQEKLSSGFTRGPLAHFRERPLGQGGRSEAGFYFMKRPRVRFEHCPQGPCQGR